MLFGINPVGNGMLEATGETDAVAAENLGVLGCNSAVLFTSLVHLVTPNI